MFGKQYLRWWSLEAECSKSCRIESSSSPWQCWSLHDFQTLHFICDWIGCKLCLQLVKNHDRHCFQSFELSHLKYAIQMQYARNGCSDYQYCTLFVSRDLSSLSYSNCSIILNDSTTLSLFQMFGHIWSGNFICERWTPLLFVCIWTEQIF